MTMTLRYRFATLEDVPLLALWNARLWVDEHMPGQKSLEEFTTRMHHWLARGEYQVVIFETEEGPVAYALYRPEEGGIYLRQFYVDRPFRRQGIGKRCVHLLLTEILPPGERVLIEVLEANPAGQAFWQAMGFRPYCRRLEMLPEERAAKAKPAPNEPKGS